MGGRVEGLDEGRKGPEEREGGKEGVKRIVKTL